MDAETAYGHGTDEMVGQIGGWVTIARAARRMNRSPFTVGRYITEGRLPSIRLDSRTRLVRISDVDGLLAERLGVEDLGEFLAERQQMAATEGRSRGR